MTLWIYRLVRLWMNENRDSKPHWLWTTFLNRFQIIQTLFECVQCSLTWRSPVDALASVYCVLLPILLFLNFLRQHHQHRLWIERYDRLFLFPLNRPQLLLHHTILLWTVCPTCRTRMQIFSFISHLCRTQKYFAHIENIEIVKFLDIFWSHSSQKLEIDSYLNGKAIVFDVNCVSTDCCWCEFSSETSLYAAIYMHGQFTSCCSWKWTSHTDSQFGCTATAYTYVERCRLIYRY